VWSGRSGDVQEAGRQYFLLHPHRPDRHGPTQGRSVRDGGVTASKETGEYSFSYSTTLPWLIWNEYHNANVEPDPTLFGRLTKPGPYNFQAVGARTFLAFADKVDLLPVAPYVKAERVKTSGCLMADEISINSA